MDDNTDRNQHFDLAIIFMNTFGSLDLKQEIQIQIQIRIHFLIQILQTWGIPFSLVHDNFTPKIDLSFL
jgi:hypothetical protein